MKFRPMQFFASIAAAALVGTLFHSPAAAQQDCQTQGLEQSGTFEARVKSVGSRIYSLFPIPWSSTTNSPAT